MGIRKVTIRQSVADSIADIAWYIESKGMIRTAEKFADDIYDFIEKLGDTRRTYNICREPDRALLGYKCLTYK